MVPELLDTDAGTPGEVAGSIQDLRMFNSIFGGVHTMSQLLRCVARQRQLRELSLLDVAGSEGYVAAKTQQVLSRSGITLKPVILDRATTHMDPAQPGVCGDALALPFLDNTFDAIGCSLFLHHLDPDQIISFARESLRVARHAFLIHDLERHPVHLALSYLGFPLYRSRVTRHDAPVSVRRAYTVNEIRSILEKAAKPEHIEIETFFLFRIGVIVWKQPNMT